jgi:hypothetical protein
METLRSKLMAHLMEMVESNTNSQNELSEPNLSDDFDESDIEIVRKPPPKPFKENMLKIKPEDIKDLALRRQVIRKQALRLVRVKIQNLDPSDAALSGAIISLQNKYHMCD